MSIPCPAIPPDFRTALARSGLQPLRLGGRELLPIVQGGMGVGVSAHRLAGAVARLGGVGTISSVDLRRHHADLMAQTAPLESRVSSARPRPASTPPTSWRCGGRSAPHAPPRRASAWWR
jgi:hypothetical protein